MQKIIPISGLLAAAILTACGGSSSDRNATGTMGLDITDAPADNLEQVQLTISAIGLKPAGGPEEKVLLDEPIVISNLLDLEGPVSEQVMPETTLPAGAYNWLRLYIIGSDNDSFVTTVNGEQFPLYVPGQQNNTPGKERHIQLVSGFVIPVDGSVDYTLDVDVRRAITKPSNQSYYLIRPAFRIIDNAQVGTITGTVADSLVNGEQCNNDLDADTGNNVYLYAGDETGDVYVDEQGQPLDDSNPITVANVRQADNGSYAYSIGFVPEGSYTLAFTCQGLSDDPAVKDELVFSAQSNATVTAGDTTVVNF